MLPNNSKGVASWEDKRITSLLTWNGHWSDSVGQLDEMNGWASGGGVFFTGGVRRQEGIIIVSYEGPLKQGKLYLNALPL